MNGFTISLSIGRFGGIYFWWGFSKRLCLGWLAITFIPIDDLALLPDKGQILDELDK